MNHHEREYFVSRIRAGYHKVTINGRDLKIYPPTIDDELEANFVYLESFKKAEESGLMTEEEMVSRLVSKGMWSLEKENKVKGLPEDIERFQVEIYNHRFNSEIRDKARFVLDEGRKQLSDLLLERSTWRENTCEGQAIMAKSLSIMSNCTYVDGKKFDFAGVDMKTVWYHYCSQFLDESVIREIARSEPWQSIWLLSKDGIFPLFSKNERELNVDQRNAVIWARTYDNINESAEAPSKSVVDDDDMLDGWFVVQRRKRDRERLESEIDQNPKSRNADEVFIMVSNAKDAQRVDDLNDPHINKIKSDRFKVIKDKGVAQQHDFQDEKLKLFNKHNEQFKGKFNNG